MLILCDNDLEAYKKNNLKIQPDWKERDFITNIKDYLDNKTEKILAVSGLRGTGKTVGILQATKNYDPLYILVQKEEPENGRDYINLLKNTKKKNIIFDEYSWIKEREDLDYYLLTAVQHGKRIILTATESITLDLLNYGALIHRVSVLHTTMFTYEEYLRMNNKKHSKENCREYLLKGGVFEEYAINSFESMKNYIEEAIVCNLSGYLKDAMDKDKARTLTYAVLFKAVCPSNLSSIPTLYNNGIDFPDFLKSMGVKPALTPTKGDLKRVADIFEQIGIIVRIPNFVQDSPLDEQYYIVNPSLTCQLIQRAYDLDSIDKKILGHVFESCVAVQLAINRMSEHEVCFYNNVGLPNTNSNKEIDLVVTDKERDFAYLLECKFSENEHPDSSIALLSGYPEKHEFEHIDIEGRYIIYCGRPVVKRNFDVGTVIMAPIGDILHRYFDFSGNIKAIESSDKIRQAFKKNTLRSWFIETYRGNVRNLDIMHGKVFNKDGIPNGHSVNTSSVKSVTINEQEKEYEVQTEHTLYHCSFDSINFEEQDKSSFVLPDYERIKKEYSQLAPDNDQSITPGNGGHEAIGD